MIVSLYEKSRLDYTWGSQAPIRQISAASLTGCYFIEFYIFSKIFKAETTARLEELAKPRRTGGKSDEKEMSDLEKRTQRYVDFDRLMRLAEPRKFREKAVKLVDRKV